MDLADVDTYISTEAETLDSVPVQPQLLGQLRNSTSGTSEDAMLSGTAPVANARFCGLQRDPST